MRLFLFLIPALLLAAEPPSSAPHKKLTAEKTNYKESGSPTAQMVIEEYADYACPHCRLVFQELVPQIINEYVKTGKARFIHRDFPLPIPGHEYARPAAMFANAAGELGYYDLVAGQIFKTQAEWTQNGNIDAQVAKVLPPGAMQEVRELMKTDKKLEESITKDYNMGVNVDHVNETPTFVIVKNGNRQTIPVLPFVTFKTYVDRVMAQK